MVRSTVLLLLLVACDAGQPPAPKQGPAPTPAPKAELPSPDAARIYISHHRHAIARKDLVTPDTESKFLPVHGVVAHGWGMAGDFLIVVDQDALTVREIAHEMGKPDIDRAHKLTQKKLDALIRLAYAAWDEDQNGPMPQATDVRDDLIILDGDEAFYLSGTPIGGGVNGTGRPIAGRAMAAMYGAPD